MSKLFDKYVKNEEGPLRDAFLAECKAEGIPVFSEDTMKYPYLVVCLGESHGKLGVRVPCVSGDLGSNCTSRCIPYVMPDPVWYNKAPSKMTEPELHEFIAARFRGEDMECLTVGAGWVTSHMHTPSDYHCSRIYRLKPEVVQSPEELEIEELETKITELSARVHTLKEAL